MMPEKLKNIPDVTGYKLENARELLKENGAEEITVVMTSVPLYRQEQYRSGSLESVRVLKQTNSVDGMTVQLTVCELYK